MTRGYMYADEVPLTLLMQSPKTLNPRPVRSSSSAERAKGSGQSTLSHWLRK